MYLVFQYIAYTNHHINYYQVTVSETQLYIFAANTNGNDQSYNYILQIIDLVWREKII